jgi:hypothetical protein
MATNQVNNSQVVQKLAKAELMKAEPSHSNTRRAETHKIKGVKFQLIICMTLAMSFQLIHAKCLSIDMSSKYVSETTNYSLRVLMFK